MQLSLARWDNEYGESAGYWLVRELPGFVLEFCFSEWHVSIPYPDGSALAGTYLESSPNSVWGSGWAADQDLISSLSDVMNKSFPTRFAAFAALESALYPAAANSSSLCEVVS